MKPIVTGLAIVAIVACLTPLRSYAGGEVQDARVQKGKVSYDKYCTPCHGPGGAPGSAVFAATKKPVDLRTIAQRNGGTFPASGGGTLCSAPNRAACTPTRGRESATTKTRPSKSNAT